VIRHLPNLLTLSRLAMAVAIFVLLAMFDADQPASVRLMDVALAIFVVAMVTDALDGYLARRFNVSTAFGRISDPFVDKVLVCGSFAALLGANFTTLAADGQPANLAGLPAWAVVVIFTREIFVTGIRGFSESRGQAFTATVFGKAKMFLQCVALVYLLVYLGHLRDAGEWARWTRDAVVWVAVLATAASALVYVGRTRALMTTPEPPSS
jgi:CDP-diacylglycerol--glycerol-3-phosphate 3-phosphatidyltransferase